MKRTRAVAIVLFAFLFGGSSAEVAVQAKRAIDRHLAAEEEGSAGELVAFELRGAGGELLARPRLLATPGRPAQLELRDPERPHLVRVALRVETTREASGDVSVEYELELPGQPLALGRVSVTPGVEQALDLGEGLAATLLTLPVPSAAFDAYLAAERQARLVAFRDRT
ncbi:hypothetical protein [Anaeromyxobacter diazotrophicus]|uniref:Uncharacterized protein n=1 Tax=Anaeromyxobacter diazotrophicus TaxID=2590199 RepID=A0A7I9VMF8_9BACT|nr:hypothetical protein [Anaeromyxobacter diazotrophicus]GEJ57584.1 hypothetical protein AMYX_23250 [Anaeromyxobacter diazotrophicus]